MARFTESDNSVQYIEFNEKFFYPNFVQGQGQDGDDAEPIDAVTAAFTNILGWDEDEVTTDDPNVEWWVNAINGDVGDPDLAGEGIDPEDFGAEFLYRTSEVPSSLDVEEFGGMEGGRSSQVANRMKDDVGGEDGAGFSGVDPDDIRDQARQIRDAVVPDQPGEGQPEPDPTGETFTLTEDTDLVHPDGEDYENEDGSVTAEDFDGETFQATEKNDTIEATVSSLSSEKTLGNGDRLDGGEGEDTLDVAMEGNFTGFSGDGGMSNVEQVELENEGSIARTFNASGIEGAEQYTLDASGSGINLADLPDAEASVAINEQSSGTATLGFDSDSPVVDGEEDELDVALDSVGTPDDPDTDKDEEEAVTLTADHIETLNLEAAEESENVVSMGSDDAEQLTAGGEGSLKVNQVSAATESIDASQLGGDADLALDNATDIEQVATGAGDDTIRVADVGDDLTTNAEINGGEGSDQLNVAGDGTVQYGMSNVETVNVGEVGGGDQLKFSAKNTSGLERVEASANMTGTASFSSMGGNDLNMDVLGENGNGAELNSDHTGATTVDVKASEEADEDNQEVNDTDIQASKSGAVNLNVGEYAVYDGTIDAKDANSVEGQIDGQLDGAQIDATSAQSGVFTTTGDEDASVGLNAGDMTDLRVTSSEGFDLTGGNTDLGALEALTVETGGHFNGGDDLDSVSEVNLSGTGAATLGNLGSDDQDYPLNITAEGLGGDDDNEGLTAGTTDVGAGQSISVNAAEVLGQVTLDDATVAQDGDGNETGSIDINVDGTNGDVTLGKLQAEDVTVEAAGALGDNITYNDGMDASGGADDGYDDIQGGGNADIVASNSVTLNGSELAENSADIVGTEDDFSATLIGGLEDDEYAVQWASDEMETATLDGDLGEGDDSLSVEIADNTTDDEIITADYNVSGVETVSFDFEDADDEVELSSGSELKTENLHVNNGTLDVSNLENADDFEAVDGVTVNSGLSLTGSQVGNTGENGISGNGNVSVEVRDDDDAKAFEKASDKVTAKTTVRVNENASQTAQDAVNTAVSSMADNGVDVSKETVSDKGDTTGSSLVPGAEQDLDAEDEARTVEVGGDREYTGEWKNFAADSILDVTGDADISGISNDGTTLGGIDTVDFGNNDHTLTMSVAQHNAVAESGGFTNTEGAETIAFSDKVDTDGGDSAGQSGIDTYELVDGESNTFQLADDGQEVIGGSGDDTITGGDGDDTIRGGEGDDLLIGGSGDDAMSVGAGQDNVFVLEGNTGNETITLDDGGSSESTDFNGLYVGGSFNDSVDETEETDYVWYGVAEGDDGSWDYDASFSDGFGLSEANNASDGSFDVSEADVINDFTLDEDAVGIAGFGGSRPEFAATYDSGDDSSSIVKNKGSGNAEDVGSDETARILSAGPDFDTNNGDHISSADDLLELSTVESVMNDVSNTQDFGGFEDDGEGAVFQIYDNDTGSFAVYELTDTAAGEANLDDSGADADISEGEISLVSVGGIEQDASDAYSLS